MAPMKSTQTIPSISIVVETIIVFLESYFIPGRFLDFKSFERMDLPLDKFFGPRSNRLGEIFRAKKLLE